MYKTVLIERDARGVATMTLNRPEKHNAMSGEMLLELKAAAEQLALDDEVRVVVLTGAGKSFCAGGDLGWMQQQMQADAATRGAEARVLAEMLQVLNTLPKPLIGAIQGNAFGGGVGMSGARSGSDVDDYAECAAAQYALIRGYGFARHVRTTMKQAGGNQTADAVYTISPSLPRGLRTIDAEVVVANCAANGIPTV